MSAYRLHNAHKDSYCACANSHARYGAAGALSYDVAAGKKNKKHHAEIHFLDTSKANFSNGIDPISN